MPTPCRRSLRSKKDDAVSSETSRSLRVAIVHPHLGIGGAGRLITDAAVQLQQAGHRVTLLTTHHDRTRSFEEVRDGTVDVRVYGDFLPLQVAGRVRVPAAIVRMCYLATAMALRDGRFDVILCDLLAHVIPLLRVLNRARVVFYCHFPDQLLAPRGSRLYRLYRAPIDWLEGVTLGMAHRILVNSQFTASMFRETFRAQPLLQPEVLYPGVDVVRHADVPPIENGTTAPGAETTILSISRYHQGKNVALAVEALAALRERLRPEAFAGVRLVMAGGFDPLRQENSDALNDLEARARRHGLTGQVSFLRSISDAERLALLARARCVVYTPQHEHFGIVPVEAMAAGRPVVGVDSGGVRETVRHGETGLLAEPTPQAFAAALAQLIEDREQARRMGQAGRRRAQQCFSRTAFGSRLEEILRAVVAES